jgi:hypothetical protein
MGIDAFAHARRDTGLQRAHRVVDVQSARLPPAGIGMPPWQVTQEPLLRLDPELRIGVSTTSASLDCHELRCAFRFGLAGSLERKVAALR